MTKHVRLKYTVLYALCLMDVVSCYIIPLNKLHLFIQSTVIRTLVNKIMCMYLCYVRIVCVFYGRSQDAHTQ